MGEFIYTMKNVRKAIGDKVILDDVTMAFYPGAKIGVVGPNGAGKSSICLLYTSDAADDTPCVDLGGRRIIKKIFFFKQKTAY